MTDEHKGFTAAGFTPQQAEFLGALLNALKTLAEAPALAAKEEAILLRRVLESKGVISAAELEAERAAVNESFQTTLELESMVDPELKRGLEQIEEQLRRRHRS